MLALQVAICFLFGVKMMSDILAIYHRELFPNTSCLLTIGNHLCVVEFNWSSLHWLLFLFAFSLAKVCVNSRCLPYHLWILLISCSCLVFSRYSESGDPTLCILYSNTNPLYNAQLVGSYLIFSRTLFLWSLSSVCWWKASRFLLVPCAIMKVCWELGLFGTILSLGVWHL